jgi:hypothetical protein
MNLMAQLVTVRRKLDQLEDVPDDTDEDRARHYEATAFLGDLHQANKRVVAAEGRQAQYGDGGPTVQRQEEEDQERARLRETSRRSEQSSPLRQPSQLRPESKEVDDWNNKALYALGEGKMTEFLQVGELVIILNPAAGKPPGLNWFHQQAGVVRGWIEMKWSGKSDMVANRPAPILVKDVQDEDAFRKAIARFSNRRVFFNTVTHGELA